VETQTQLDHAASVEAIASGARRRLSVTIIPRTILFAALVVIALVALWLVVSKAGGTLVLLTLALILGEAIRPLMLRLQRYHIPGPRQCCSST
jgi:predicted PurR-regulated permease PerM